MKRRRAVLPAAAVAGGTALAVLASWRFARRLSRRLLSPEGLSPVAMRRKDLVESLSREAAFCDDFRHRGSPRHPVSLAAVFASPGQPARRPTILFLHGKGGAGAEWAPDALRALRLGYNVLVPDLRGHGASGGDFVTYGVLEAEDLEGTIEEAARRNGLDPERLGLHACSAGSITALELAARRPGIAAIWLESPWADPRRMALHYLGIATGLPDWMLRLPARWAIARAVSRVRREAGLGKEGGLSRIDPVSTLSRLRLPVLLAHGEEDRLVPPRFAGRLEAVLPAGGEVFRVAGAGHCHHENEASKVAAAAYAAKWKEFFGRHLPAP